MQITSVYSRDKYVDENSTYFVIYAILYLDFWRVLLINPLYGGFVGNMI